jgi:Abortive infection alpha
MIDNLIQLGSTGAVIAALKYSLPKTADLLDTFLGEIGYKILEKLKGSREESRKIINAMEDLDPLLREINGAETQKISADIGIPIIEKLSYISSPSIRKIYIGMLAIAASKEKVKKFHPRHLNIISLISIEELDFLKELAISETKCILLYEHIKVKKGESSIYLNIFDVFPRDFEKRENFNLVIENLCSLGLLIAEKKVNIGLNKKFQDYLDINFIKIRPDIYKYKIDSNEFSNVRFCLPKDEEYDYVCFDSTQYKITVLGYYFIEIVTSFNEVDENPKH